METEKEIQDFVDQMAILMGESSPLLKTDERNKAAKGYYKNWRKIVAENMNDILDYRRLVNEARELELNIAEIERILSDKSLELDQARSRSDELQLEVDELRELLESCKRWAEAAGRIAEKRMQVNQKKDDLSMSIADIGGRDLKTVEREVADRLEKKDNVSNQVSGVYWMLNERHACGIGTNLCCCPSTTDQPYQ
jgi:chromosome segregation ATPase